ncbi:ATP phosphoribosyltransferase regulatory subunit [Klebsiella pneumoniae]|uniref:Eco57I restriction-modification methylase domain-containing protein n=1 Tax=Klebsiella pneumoniae TaxID=573 RepID=UPI001C7F5A3E|nr:ATP phosphoribosyltransferase regulatory subunit [Klebsiella pneumoniae]EIX9393604.1 ATP phosphoribosyltransferase regulatory subunit [Klebsiella pneumoniae]MBX4700418.1 ATP phosphoribosyltransferase regulatory subunit [Klebsiella pneumoniae]
MSLTNNHAEWLSLVDISGPFLAIPVLTHTFPQGLEELSSFKRRRLRQAYDEWREALELEDPQLEDLHSAWIDEVLSRVLEFDDDGKGDVLKREEWCRSHLKSVLPDQGVVEYPDLAVVDEQQDNKPLLLIHTYKPNVELESTVKHEGWITTPADRMVQLCRSLGCRLGLLTNGECWMLVDAPVGAVTSFSSWYARLWSLEPITLQAFVHLLGIRRFFVDETEQLPALFDASLEYQDDVTDALGEQVCRAVEVLIQSLDKADQDRNRELLCDVSESELYEAALTVMMRLVFLLSAEERGLLLLGDECYESNYAISTLRMQLRQEPSEILERRWDAWTRLLATFRAVYCGIEHENLRLPALGSSLFDPDHFPFLEGRAKESNWKNDTAVPLPIDNRTVLLLLEAIQVFQGRTLSYRALDVEQIGYVYEGLLERTVRRADEVTLELNATRKAQSPWITLAELDSVCMDGTEQLIKLLHERSGSSTSKVRNDLSKTIDEDLIERLLITCQGDIKLRDRIKPYVHLLRTDPWGYPLVYPAGAFMVIGSSNRRETGTHYTPKSLTEAIVAETLTPLTYFGPVEGSACKEWTLKTPAELLDLKICDPAMGSGAFLVQACRWLADRLVEAWAQAEIKGKIINVYGNVLDDLSSNELMPHDIDARINIARYLIAERCLYGVDLNPLAVELAKLSIWLVTLAKGRPFGFLDHSLRCGDSLLGIHQVNQLIELSVLTNSDDQDTLFSKDIRKAIYDASKLRQRLREMPIGDIHDIEEMERLNTEAHKRLYKAKKIADALVGEIFATGANFSAREARLKMLSLKLKESVEEDENIFMEISYQGTVKLQQELPSGRSKRIPIHWPLEFPEVFIRTCSGFDAIIGNPPFLGGRKITGVFGNLYREYLVANIAKGERGSSADLVAYFFLRSFYLLRESGCLGLIAVNSIAEGDSRQIGLERLLQSGAQIFSATPNEPWPGKAAVVTSRIHLIKGAFFGEKLLNGKKVAIISAFLSDQNEWSPKILKENLGQSFQGTIVLGMGFILDETNAMQMLDSDKSNSEVIFPYINGDDLNSNPTHKPSRWVINFWDWPEERAKNFKFPYAWVENKVKPERQRLKLDGTYALRKPLPIRWWQYADKRPALYHAIGKGDFFERHPKNWSTESRVLENIIAISRHTKFFNPVLIPNTAILSDATVVLAFDSFAYLAWLNSSLVQVWVQKLASFIGLTIRFTPSDCFDTLPKPNNINNVELITLGKEYHQYRKKLMVNRDIGLTQLYNLFHDPNERDSELNILREKQLEIDVAILNIYGWDDINLSHDFYNVAYLPENDNKRFTISEPARIEVLRRLAELNRERYQDEVNQDLHARKSTRS